MRSWRRSAPGGRGRCQERAAGAGLVPGGCPGGLEWRFVSARLCRSPARSRPALGRAAPPSPCAQPFKRRVVTKHYKKGRRSVPGIEGGGARAPIYPPARPPRLLQLGLPAPPPPAPPLRPRTAPHRPARPPPRPSPRPRPADPGARRGAGRTPRRSSRDARTGRLPLWTSRPSTSGRRAGRRWPPRLGTLGGAAPRPETPAWEQPPGMW